jgi:hypothetical protein
MRNLISTLGLNSNLKLVVDEGNDHSIEERDQIGGLVILHLLVTLHENEGAIG